VCGLCCNGVLFADVELRSTDQPQRLRALGLKLHAKQKKLALAQPCACWLGQSCRIYPNRPAQCRSFACGTLKRVLGGERTMSRALQIIATAKQRVALVESLFGRLGNRNSHLPLTRRYADLMREPLDLGGDPAIVKARSRLSNAMAELMKLLDRHFRS
jgi:hypothetical protein